MIDGNKINDKPFNEIETTTGSDMYTLRVQIHEDPNYTR